MLNKPVRKETETKTICSADQISALAESCSEADSRRIYSPVQECCSPARRERMQSEDDETDVFSCKEKQIPDEVSEKEASEELISPANESNRADSGLSSPCGDAGVASDCEDSYIQALAEEMSEILKQEEGVEKEYAAREEQKQQKSEKRIASRHQNEAKISEITLKAVQSAQKITNAKLYGRHTFFEYQRVRKEEFPRIWRRFKPITSICTSFKDLKSDKGPDKERIKAFFELLNEHYETIQPKFGRNKISEDVFVSLYRILIPHDLSEEAYKEFVKGFLIRTPYENGMPFIVTTIQKGNGTYLGVFICERMYYAEAKEIPVQAAKKNQFYDSKTGRSCRSDHPNAVLRCKAGTVIRSIKTHFGHKKQFLMNREDFLALRDRIIKYMNEFFDEQECTVDSRVLLARYDGTKLQNYSSRPRFWNKLYNSLALETEKVLTELYLDPEYGDCTFPDLVKAIREVQCDHIYVPQPGEASFRKGYKTLRFYGAVQSLRQEYDLFKTLIRTKIRDFLDGNYESLTYRSVEDPAYAL